MEFKFPSIDKYLKPDDIVIRSNQNSKDYINIPKLMSEYGLGLVGSLKMRAPILHKMIGCMWESKISSSSIVKNPKQNKRIISLSDFIKLEDYIKSFGIDIIGYTKVPSDFIFKGHKILYGNAIVLIMEMKKNEIMTAPSKKALKEVFRTYYDLGVAVNKIAEFLRKQGFNAMAGPAVGGDVNYVPLAEKAGLGAMGKHGLLISEKSYGASLRIAAVYTDIENLPFATENKHLWIKDFCKTCGKCVRNCPAKAIYEKSLPTGRCIDQTKCAVPFANDLGCSVCIKSCTFFNNDYEKIKKSFMK